MLVAAVRRRAGNLFFSNDDQDRRSALGATRQSHDVSRNGPVATTAQAAYRADARQTGRASASSDLPAHSEQRAEQAQD